LIISWVLLAVQFFRKLYTIIYLAAISRVNPDLYEAADIDGASKFMKMWHITLPAIRPIVSISFVRTMGGLLDVSFEQTLIMNNAMVSRVADVMSYYIYQIGILGFNQYSYATAMGLFNSVLALMIIIITNYGAKRIDEDGGLW
jgi:putative aldouronate transport system permease protein